MKGVPPKPRSENHRLVQTGSEVYPSEQEEESTSLRAFSLTRNMNKEISYFDSGCSQHMIGNRNILTNLQPSRQDNVIFRVGTKGKIVGTRALIFLALSRLKDVLLVEGLTLNLISVSQLCDDGFLVRFTKEKFMVFDQNQYQIIEGKRFSENCYLVTSTNIRTRDTWFQQPKHKSNRFQQNISS